MSDWAKLPGDPNLPPGVTSRDIDGSDMPCCDKCRQEFCPENEETTCEECRLVECKMCKRKYDPDEIDHGFCEDCMAGEL